MSTPLKLATISAAIGLPASALFGSPPSEKRILGTIATLVILGIASQFAYLAGVVDIFAWILIVLIWLNDGAAIIEKLG
jgi:hypothetical protein